MIDLKNPKEGDTVYRKGRRYVYSAKLKKWQRVEVAEGVLERLDPDMYPPDTVHKMKMDFLQGERIKDISAKYEVDYVKAQNLCKKWKKEAKEVRELAIEQVASKLVSFNDKAAELLNEWIERYLRILPDEKNTDVENAKVIVSMIKDLQNLVQAEPKKTVDTMVNVGVSFDRDKALKILNNDPAYNKNADKTVFGHNE